MKLRFSLLVILLIICFSHIDARHRQRGGKSLSRSKRTIGDIINWKLNLIQSILGGIGGIFGGGKSPRPSYGPPRPQRPSYGSRPQKPSYGNQRPSRPRPRPRPQPQPRPSGYNARPQRPGGASRPAGRPQFGPSNAIKMLKAPNLATAAPPAASSAGGGYQSASLGGPALDTGLTSPQSPDTYGSPQAAPVASSTNTDSYGSPQAAPISSLGSPRAPVSPPAPPPSTNTYSSPQSPQSPQSSILSPQAQYGSGATNTFSSGSDPLIVDNSVAFSPSAQDTYSVAQPSPPVVLTPEFKQAPAPAPAPAPDSYGGAQFPVLTPSSDTSSLAQPSDPVILAPEPAVDSYGGAQFPVLAPASDLDTSSLAQPEVLSPVVVATTARSLTVDYSYDDYDPSDVPPDQAAPELPSYGISSTIAPDSLDTYGVASNSGLSDDYDPSDVPADQAAAAVVVELQPQPTYGGDTRDVYGSAVAPVGTSAPVPDDAFTGDYPASQDTVIDLTDDLEDYQDYQASLATGNEVLDLLPPVEEDDDYQETPVTPTSSPVLFTYAPSEGSTVDDLTPQLNIVVQAPEAGGSLRDPLNVIPDQYEDYEYDEEDEDVLSNYIELREELEEYSPQDIETDPTPTPAFEDLRGIEFTTGSPLLSAQDPVPTTYRAPIDFDLGTTAATGIEVDDVVLLKTEDYEDIEDYEDFKDSLANSLDTTYSDSYETEDETDYEPGSENIPIVLEGGASQQAEALPSYDPVVLLVGTPEKSDSDSREEIPLFENDLDERVQAKRKAQAKKGSSNLKDLYNNWYGPRNDWSRKIAKVQGRIRFKKLQAQKLSS